MCFCVMMGRLVSSGYFDLMLLCFSVPCRSDDVAVELDHLCTRRRRDRHFTSHCIQYVPVVLRIRMVGAVRGFEDFHSARDAFALLRVVA